MSDPAPDSHAASEDGGGVLAGVRVLEMAAPGPVTFAGMMLADMGAEILRVVRPAGSSPDDGTALTRGRATLSCDLGVEGAAAAILEVTRVTDIVLEGFRPGVMERRGLGPDVCLAGNPALVYGRMTGWGQSGPLAQSPGHDPNYLGLTGALDAIGYPDRPPVQPINLVADLGGGAMYLIVGVLAALLAARSSGVGQVVDCAMVDGVSSLMTSVHEARAAGAWSGRRHDNLMDGGCPYSSVYATADGGHLAVAALEPRFYANFVGALGLTLEELPPREDRDNWPTLHARFAAVLATRTRDEWVQRLAGCEACVTPVLDLDEALHDPHLVARGTFDSFDGRPVPAPAPRFAATPSQFASAQDPADLLGRWDVAGTAIERLTGEARVCL